MSGKAPFFHIQNEVAIILKVVEGSRPSRLEASFSVHLWLLLEQCWAARADRRPTMTSVLQRLVTEPIRARVEGSRPDWDETSSARFRLRRLVQEWPLIPSVIEVKRRMTRNITPLPASSSGSGLERPLLVQDTHHRSAPGVTSEPSSITQPVDSHAARDSQETSLTTLMIDAPSPASPRWPPPGSKSAPSPGELYLHLWLNHKSSQTFQVELSSVEFTPPAHWQGGTTGLTKPAFYPSLRAARILHREIAHWPVELCTAGEYLTVGDVLQGLHKSLHNRITRAEWDVLDHDKQEAVTNMFALRCRLEAAHSGPSQADMRNREIVMRNDGVKRVDFLLGETIFTGLVLEQRDPACWRVLTT